MIEVGAQIWDIRLGCSGFVTDLYPRQDGLFLKTYVRHTGLGERKVGEFYLAELDRLVPMGCLGIRDEEVIMVRRNLYNEGEESIREAIEKGYPWYVCNVCGRVDSWGNKSPGASEFERPDDKDLRTGLRCDCYRGSYFRADTGVLIVIGEERV